MHDKELHDFIKLNNIVIEDEDKTIKILERASVPRLKNYLLAYKAAREPNIPITIENIGELMDADGALRRIILHSLGKSKL